MKRRVDLLLLAGGLLVLTLLAVGRQTATQSGDGHANFSSYDAGPNGYRALYETLRRAGVAVRRFERVLPLVDSGTGTLLIAIDESDPQPVPLTRADADALQRFVAGGGRLVVLDSGFAGKLDVTPGVGTSHPIDERAAVALARNRFTAGVERVAAPIGAAFGFEHWPNAVPLLANDRGVVAVAYRHGKGTVVAITAPALFGNAHLLDGDNLAFAYDTVAGGGPVAFDEYVHGHDSDATFWQVLPPPVRAAVWIVALVIGLALIGANVPFAPPIPPDPPPASDSGAFVDAMAALMRRARAGGALTAAFAADAARRSRGRRASAGDAEAFDELQRLSLMPASDARLLRAAVLEYRFRKEHP